MTRREEYSVYDVLMGALEIMAKTVELPCDYTAQDSAALLYVLCHWQK